MKRVRLTVAYDGTGYCGFQLQPGCATVEGVLNSALSELTGENITVIGASRTDSGVHAKGNVAVFDTASSIPGDRFFAALNTKLPRDIRVTESEEVPEDWHPRRQECIKTYEYCADTSFVPDPMKIRYSMHWPRKMNVAAMREAAAYLLGEHDFTGFANPSSQVLKEGGSPVRTLTEISVTEEYPEKDSRNAAQVTFIRDREDSTGERPYLRIRVTGDGFLYNMVRIIAGTLLDVGTGRFSPEDVKGMLEARDRKRAGITAEPQGLTLISICYTGREKLKK